MCTVTFIPQGDRFFFTSSRDERAGRAPAAFPQLYEINRQVLLFPKDGQSGGSWIAVHESGNVAVLLNGAVKAHRPEPPYLKSRGIVLLDIISELSPVDTFEAMNLKGIEPFTLVLFEDKKLWSGRWDGKMKWMESPDSHKPHIWSSATLYDPQAIRKRENWFNTWIQDIQYPGTLDIIHFHQKGGDGDPFNDILMNRSGQIFTNSISSIYLSPETAQFRYLDLCSRVSSDHLLSLQKMTTFKS